MEWVPYSCRRVPKPKWEVDKCLEGKRVHFHGDSHMRALFNAFADRTCGVAGVAVKEEFAERGSVCARPGQIIHGEVPRCSMKELCEWEDLYYSWRPSPYVSTSQGIVAASFSSTSSRFKLDYYL
jgi:hypothetical protein